MSIFVLELFKRPAYFVITTLVVLFSVCLHEYFHALSALLLGDDTAARRGHLSMNPLRQMGLWALIIFLLLGFTWGSVPVDMEKLRSRHKWGPTAVALAGPLANLILAVIGWCAYGFISVQPQEIHLYVRSFIFIFGTLNIVLFLFNLIPIPGLDGWNAVMSWFPRAKIFSSETVKGVMLFLIFIAMFSVSYIFDFANFLMDKAPLKFSRVSVSENAFKGSLDDLAQPLHEMFWKAETRVIFMNCSHERMNGILYGIALMSPEQRAVKYPAFSGRVKKAVTARCGDDGFIFIREDNDAMVAYRLEWADECWHLVAADNPQPMLDEFNKVRCAAKNPENVGSPAVRKALEKRGAEILVRTLRFQASRTHEGWRELQPCLSVTLAMDGVPFNETLRGCDFEAKCTDVRFSDNNNNAELTFQVTVRPPQGQPQQMVSKFRFEYYPDRGWVLGN